MKKHKAVKRFGKTIRTVRRARNITLEELAGEVETDAAWLSKVERGEKNITLTTAARLAEALSIEFVIGDCKLT